jgi:succinate dehydrogenase / fumarate reductase flavoprotein subunit
MTQQGERRLATSVLVIGSGGAGLRAAIELAERGVDVLVVGKRAKADAHTTLAAGGINAALSTMDAEDSWQQHAADTIKESYLLARPETVRIVAENAARGIEDLERWGMPFAREADGRISGFRDLAHALDLKASALAARATLEAALERRETRGCHNRADFPGPAHA